MQQKDDPTRRDISCYSRRFTQRILYSDMDSLRHLNNGATARYFEEGRADVNMSVFGTECMTDPQDSLQILFANVQIDYVAQAHYPGTVEITSAVGRIGSSSWTIVQAAFQNGTCFALSHSVMVKARNGKSEPLSEQERAGFTALLLAAADA